MKMKYSKNAAQGPSSSIGIMKFKESNAGPTFSPEIVVGFAVVVAIILLVLRFFIL